MLSKKASHLVPLLPFFSLLFLIGSSYIETGRLTGSRDAYLSFVILQLLTFVLPAIFFCKARGENYIFRLKIRLFGLEKGVFLLFSVLVMIAAVTAVELGMRKLGISGGLYAHSVYTIYGRTLPELGSNIYDTLYTTVVFAVLPAITEEFAYRAVLYNEYEPLGAPAAIFLTAFLYSLLGLNMVSFVPSFAGGLVLGFSVYITQSVLAPILIHICYNLYSLFFEEYIWAFIAKPENEIFFTFLIVTVLLVSVILMLSQAERVIYDKGFRGLPFPDGRTADGPTAKEAFRGFLGAAAKPAYLGCIVLFALRVAGIL